MSTRSLQLHPRDNVAVALHDLPAAEVAVGIPLRESIPAGHKFAVVDIAAGAAVYKFGFPIGVASQPIAAGSHVHSHNVTTGLSQPGTVESLTPAVSSAPASLTEPSLEELATEDRGAPKTFWGHRRSDGRVACRNEIWIINTVACVNQTANRLADLAQRELRPEFPEVDGFYAFPHPFGCSQLGDDLANTQRILAGLINHPHAAGVLVLGLGCENNRLAEQLALVDPAKQSRVRSFSTQAVDDEEAAGLQVLRELAELANEPREELPLAELVIGMKCGGSDGFSGITANPLVGRVADRHCGRGGTVLLTEIPEMFGAEEVLAARCPDAAMRERVAETIEDFKNYFRRHGEPISENPSPGNKSGGITTLEEKSLGCVQKAGTSGAIHQVLAYGEPAAPRSAGLGIIYGPGNDGVSITALAAAGANLILFTTGRGTPMGAPVPTLKIATNRELAQHKPRWIDFDAGRLLDGTADFPILTRELEELCWQIANRQRPAQNEVNGFREIAIWKTGVTL